MVTEPYWIAHAQGTTHGSPFGYDTHVPVIFLGHPIKPGHYNGTITVNFWIWVPGIEWAPTWVTWRVGGGYIGWAPLPPRRLVGSVAAPQFVFVGTARFSDPVRPSSVIVNNTTIIRQTTVINNIKNETRSIGGAGPARPPASTS